MLEKVCLFKISIYDQDAQQLRGVQQRSTKSSWNVIFLKKSIGSFEKSLNACLIRDFKFAQELSLKNKISNTLKYETRMNFNVLEFLYDSKESKHKKTQLQSGVSFFHIHI